MSQRQPNYQENKGQISTIYLIVQHSLKVRKSEDGINNLKPYKIKMKIKYLTFILK